MPIVSARFGVADIFESGRMNFRVRNNQKRYTRFVSLFLMFFFFFQGEGRYFSL